jgi:hypothetical protein
LSQRALFKGRALGVGTQQIGGFPQASFKLLDMVKGRTGVQRTKTLMSYFLLFF